ncbi:GNAT family N-acetyltransferase [Arthrobacter sp. B1805]|uniref:GNAT family N-acetyltransferase n=1 Tax=Arthrobacter sp. B1805 TaxID=2058892 RepID=UPI000CE5367D|nr:N-acetyltransferase [Arthrobacter sp. B1805]
MTELMHTANTDSSMTAATVSRSNVVSFARPAHQTPADSRTTGLQSDTHRGEDHLSTEDLTTASTRQLRIMANQVYRMLDTDYPPPGAVERYQSVVDELGYRARQAMERGPVAPPRETFRDNLLYRRFELFVDGRLAAYLKYSMNGGQVNLLDGVEQTGFRDQGFDTTLMRHVMLNVHKRRLNVAPQCPMAFSFLADHPEFRLLATRSRA